MLRDDDPADESAFELELPPEPHAPDDPGDPVSRRRADIDATPDDADPPLPDIGVWHDPVLEAKLGNPDAVRLFACGEGQAAWELDTPVGRAGALTEAWLWALDQVGDGVVAWDVAVTNQDGDVVASYDILTLVAKRG